MIHLAYIVMGYILLAEVLLFLLLALPTPHGVKARIVKVILNSKVIKIGQWIFLGLCIVSGVFYAELHQTENFYNTEKESLRLKGNGHIGTEMRLNFLSYQTQRIQRDKYVTSMLIYATIVLGAYIGLLYHIYESRGDFKEENTGNQETLSDKRISSLSENRGSSVSNESKKVK